MLFFEKEPYPQWTHWPAVGVLFVTCILAWAKLANLWLVHLETTEVATRQYSQKDVIGTLGNLPVRMPRYAVHDVEFEKPRRWDKGQKGPGGAPGLTPQLRKFEFDVRYPDMRMIDSYPAFLAQRSESDTETMWVHMDVRNIQKHRQTRLLDPVITCMLDPTAQPSCSSTTKDLNFALQRDAQFGLTVYAIKGEALLASQMGRRQKNKEDVFVAQDPKGRVLTLIRCRNRGFEEATCSHGFSMEHALMRAEINVDYRRGLLPHWQDIQARLTQSIQSIVAQPPLHKAHPKPQASKAGGCPKDTKVAEISDIKSELEHR